ncbi:unnamed protein product [Miscanthus lutarioriparius]|uniref:Uncharacterized protein n=1 Tax=Miscanthus lutarioriparius TaxID=422564 RepID=A0A811QEX1_9POAL|nr:unnamed protein product [Miscanthus lutarioriparius]
MVSKLVASLVHLLRTGNGQRWRRASEMPEVICGAVDVGRAAPRGGGSAVAPTSPLGSTAIHYHPYPTGDGDMWCGSRRRVIINRRRRGGDTLKASTRRSMGIVGHKYARGNPEVYTAWNYQKLVVQHSIKELSDQQAIESVVDDELGVAH